MRILTDLKHSTRSLVRSPGLALAVLLTIAIGVGSNAAVLGFVRGFVSRDIPLPHLDRMVSLFARESQGGFGPISYEDYTALARRTDLFELSGSIRESHASIVVGDRLSILPIATITPQIAELLALPPGRVVVSDRMRRTELQSRTAAKENTIRLDGVPMPIDGTAPEWLEGLYVDRAIDVWITAENEAGVAADPRSRTLWVLARLRPGISARRAADAIAQDTGGTEAIAVQPYTGVTPEVGAGLLRINRTLIVAAAAVFFMACANVAAFLLSRSSARTHEASVHVALGASRGQLRLRLLSDSIVLAGAGGAAGLLFAFWTMSVIPALFFDQDAEGLVFSADVTAILVAAGACAGVMVLCGLTPIFHVRDDRPATVLRRESGGPSNAMRRLRTTLVVAQMACCSLLVISTALLIDGFRAAVRTSAGVRLGEPMLAAIESRYGFSRQDLGLEYLGQAEVLASAMPGALGAALMDTPPGSRPSWRTLRIEPPDLPIRDVVIETRLLTPESLDTIDLPPLSGRMFGGRDAPASCRVAIVNEAAATQLFAGDAVGRSIEDPARRRVEIIGVVSMRNKDQSRPLIYYYGDQTGLPLNAAGPGRFRVPDRGALAPAVLASNIVSPAYFETMGLKPTAGEVFGGAANGSGCRVGVISQDTAELYFGGRAVGGAVIDTAGERTEIIGVVQSSVLRVSQRRSAPTLYLPVSQDFVPRMSLLVSTPYAGERDLQALRGALAGLSGGSVRRVISLEEHLSRTALAPERVAATLVGASALMALVLGVLGMYSAMAESTRQRRREIALRMALGARSWRVMRQVLAEGLMVAGAGTAAGIVASMLVARWLDLSARSLQAGASVFIFAPLVLVAAVVIASVVPMRRALSVDVLSIMRDT